MICALGHLNGGVRSKHDESLTGTNWLCACHPQHSFGDGSWRIESENVLGTVIGESANGCRGESVQIGLWGPQWGTGGLVDAEVQEESDGSIGSTLASTQDWAQRVWRCIGKGTWLGCRWEGDRVEFELSLKITEGAIDAEASRAAQRKTQHAIEEAQDAWAEGAFSIV